MVYQSAKHSISSYDDESLSDGSSPEEEKTIPFLRRLRDMLVENQEVISFAPGNRTVDTTVLGRIVVHDRVHVEAKVLPRYFNHSSFASLRRQLNYFNFVRLGKGRQRESTYVNESVVDLDDILLLKRRSTTVSALQAEGGSALREKLLSGFSTVCSHGTTEGTGKPVLDLSSSVGRSTVSLERHPKRRRSTDSLPTTVSPRSSSPVENYPISDDDDTPNQEQFVVLDLTKPEAKVDEDFLTGCKNLLCLASKRWE